MVLFSAVLLAVASVAAAANVPPTASYSPGDWSHAQDHPVRELFRRSSYGRRDGNTGSQSAPPYPRASPDPSKLPNVWKNALDEAILAGDIPPIPVATMVNGMPMYPGEVEALRNTSDVCSATSGGCRIPSNIYDAPAGVMGIGFDDGPTAASVPLYTFLQQQNQSSTHYMIGLNILNNPEEFMLAYSGINADIAVHTWTHPYLTTLTNEQVLAELAWTMQIIYDKTGGDLQGGKLPRFWRPPYGDIDVRVNAIAEKVLGLTAILWNHDTRDWTVGMNGGETLFDIQGKMQSWLNGTKTPGLVILEHEISPDTIQAFTNAWPLIKAYNWTTVSQARMDTIVGGPTYQNDVASVKSNASTSASGSASSGMGSTQVAAALPKTSASYSYKPVTAANTSATAAANSSATYFFKPVTVATTSTVASSSTASSSATSSSAADPAAVNSASASNLLNALIMSASSSSASSSSVSPSLSSSVTPSVVTDAWGSVITL